MKIKQWHFISGIGLLMGIVWMVGSTILVKPQEDQTLTAPVKGFIAPDFMLETLDGESYKLSDHFGKPILLTLWASWCAPCQAEMPTFETIYQEFGTEQIEILGVNVTSQDRLNAVKQFVSEHSLTYPILLDEKGDVAEMYRLQGLPMTYFIDPQGRIADIIVGGPISAGTARAILNELLSMEN